MASRRYRSCDWKRIFLIILNVVFVLTGLAAVGLGIYLKVKLPSHSVWGYLSGNGLIAYGAIAVGVVMVVVALCGLLGAFLRHRCLLLTYLTIVVIFVMVQIGLVIFVLVEKSNLQNHLGTVWYGTNNDTKFLLQDSLHCCGYSSSNEWKQSLPKSCFAQSTMENDTNTVDDVTMKWNRTCSDSILQYLNDNMVYAVSAAGGLFLLELLQMAMTCMMIRQINRRRANRMDYENSIDSEAAFDEFMRKKIYSETYDE